MSVSRAEIRQRHRAARGSACEDDEEALKWFKPASGHMRIYYGRGEEYEPDFVVETKTMKLICEAKRASEMDDPEVQAKARAATTWCQYATVHELKHGGKQWCYVLIPHDAVTANKTLEGLRAAFAVEGGLR